MHVQRVHTRRARGLRAIEEAVNRPRSSRFIWKPWDDAHLLITVQSAIGRFWTLDGDDRLAGAGGA